jgi:hypothetical protein
VTIPLAGTQLVQANSPQRAVELANAEAALYQSGFKVDVEFVGWLNFWETGEK